MAVQLKTLLYSQAIISYTWASQLTRASPSYFSISKLFEHLTATLKHLIVSLKQLIVTLKHLTATLKHLTVTHKHLTVTLKLCQ